VVENKNRVDINLLSGSDVNTTLISNQNPTPANHPLIDITTFYTRTLTKM